MLKLIILIWLGLELIARLISFHYEDVREHIVLGLQQNVEDFKVNGPKTRTALVVYFILFILILFLC